MDYIKTYSSKEIAERLSIQPVTVRKYSQMLESQGYSFTRDNNNWRQYSEDDIAYLKYIVNMRKSGNSLDECIEHVANLYNSNLSISQPDTPLQKPLNEIFNFIQEQQDFNQKLLKQIDQRDKRLAERDRNLMIVLDELSKTKKQIAATKQKKWWQFWK